MTVNREATREDRRARLAAEAPRRALADIIRAHYFRSSRPWPDGTEPTAPNWNPGCACGQGMYFFEHHLHLADVLLAAGYAMACGCLHSDADYCFRLRNPAEGGGHCECECHAGR